VQRRSGSGLARKKGLFRSRVFFAAGTLLWRPKSVESAAQLPRRVGAMGHSGEHDWLEGQGEKLYAIHMIGRDSL
jgi:hypothetical protein